MSIFIYSTMQRASYFPSACLEGTVVREGFLEHSILSRMENKYIKFFYLGRKYMGHSRNLSVLSQYTGGPQPISTKIKNKNSKNYTFLVLEKGKCKKTR
jgi:hypothetical protein